MNSIKSQWHRGGRQKNDVIQELTRVLKQSNKQNYFPQIINHYIGTFNVRGSFEVQKHEWSQKLSRRREKICHQSLSMKVELESVLQEDHELLWRWEIILGNVGPFLKFSSFFYCRSLYKCLEEPLVWLNKAAHSYCSVKDAPLLSWIIPDHSAAILSSSFLLYFLDNIFGRCTFSVINCICWGIFFFTQQM